MLNPPLPSKFIHPFETFQLSGTAATAILSMFLGLCLLVSCSRVQQMAESPNAIHGQPLLVSLSSPIPTLLRASWTAKPGKAIQIFGQGFGIDPTQLTVAIQPLSTGSLTPVGTHYTLSIVDLQDNLIQGTLPSSLPPDTYAVWVGNSAGWSTPAYINRAEVFWASVPLGQVYSGQTISLVGRNFINPTTGSSSGLTVSLVPTAGGLPISAAVTSSTNYSVTLVVPSVTTGTVYTFQVTNGAGGVYGVVTGMDDMASVTAVTANANTAYFDSLFQLGAAWTAKIPVGSMFNVQSCAGVNDTKAIQTQLTAAGVNGGVVNLPSGGICASSDLTMGPNTFLNGNYATLNWISPANHLLYLNAGDVVANLAMSYTGTNNLAVVSGAETISSARALESITINAPHGAGIGLVGDWILENSTITTEFSSVQGDGNLRFRNNTTTNTGAPQYHLIGFVWASGNHFIGSSCLANVTQPGCPGAYENRDMDLGSCCSFISDNVDSGYFGTPAGDDGEGFNFQQNNRIVYSQSTGLNTSTTLNDSAQNFKPNALVGYKIMIIGGTGIGQLETISANTATQATVSAPWKVTPDATSVYTIDQYVSYHNIIYSNKISAVHNQGAVELFTKCYDNIVANNSFSNSAGIFTFATIVPSTNRADIQWYNWIGENQLSPRGDDGNDFESIGQVTTYSADTLHGTVAYGNEFVGNNFTGPGSSPSSYTCYATAVFPDLVQCGAKASLRNGLALTQNNSPSAYPFAQGTLFQGNTVTANTFGVFLTNTNYDTFLNGNTLTGNSIAVKDTGSVRTTIH